MYNNLYEYVSYNKQTDTNGKRVYQIGDVLLPSVTTILSATKPKKDKDALTKWKKRVGTEQANIEVAQATGIGHTLHDNLEQYLKTGATPAGSVLVKLMTKLMIKKGLSNIDEWWGAECPLYYEGLYAGTTDLTGIYKSIPAIIDFKNSKKIKKLEWMDDYRCQLAAYSLAHNQMFNTDISAGVILMVSRDCEFQEFIIDGDLYRKSVSMWLSRLDQYYQ